MKTLNLVKTAFVILALSLIVGCSDQLTSSGDTAPQSNTKKKVSIHETEDGLPNKVVYRVRIRIKPGRSFTFSNANTPFTKFNYYEINNVVDPNLDKLVRDCENLEIYGIDRDKEFKLSCHEKGISVDQIIIQNTSSSFLDLDVTLDGTRKKINVAEDTE